MAKKKSVRINSIYQISLISSLMHTLINDNKSIIGDVCVCVWYDVMPIYAVIFVITLAFPFRYWRCKLGGYILNGCGGLGLFCHWRMVKNYRYQTMNNYSKARIVYKIFCHELRRHALFRDSWGCSYFSLCKTQQKVGTYHYVYSSDRVKHMPSRTIYSQQHPFTMWLCFLAHTICIYKSLMPYVMTTEHVNQCTHAFKVSISFACGHNIGTTRSKQVSFLTGFPVYQIKR